MRVLFSIFKLVHVSTEYVVTIQSRGTHSYRPADVDVSASSPVQRRIHTHTHTIITRTSHAIRA